MFINVMSLNYSSRSFGLAADGGSMIGRELAQGRLEDVYVGGFEGFLEVAAKRRVRSGTILCIVRSLVHANTEKMSKEEAGAYVFLVY